MAHRNGVIEETAPYPNRQIPRPLKRMTTTFICLSRLDIILYFYKSLLVLQIRRKISLLVRMIMMVVMVKKNTWLTFRN